VIDPKILDELARRLADSLPSGLKVLREDLEKNFRAAIQGALGKMDLVTREEFDVQSEVLARTRAKVDALEKEIAELESELSTEKEPKP